MAARFAESLSIDRHDWRKWQSTISANHAGFSMAGFDPKRPWWKIPWWHVLPYIGLVAYELFFSGGRLLTLGMPNLKRLS